MTYEETLEYLYTQMPMFQRQGASAYKPGLQTVTLLSEHFGSPHKKLRTIHVAGTNGKGSTAHTLAAILQAQGYHVGLFTSPHILDFRERIRIDGKMIDCEEVIDFVDRYISSGLEINPSFFELTTVMAFDWFARRDVDVAVIEVGLGGRLDSTNIITPMLSVITNISLDHTSLLGNTPAEIAGEKAGIIKPGVPVVIGESEGDVRACFARKADECGSRIVYADDSDEIISADRCGSRMKYQTLSFGNFEGELTGDYQRANALTVLEAVRILKESLGITDEAVREGFATAASATGLMGRWMTVSEEPLTICDTGHNPGGWQYLAPQIASHQGHKRLVLGFVNDKDVTSIMSMLADIDDATFYLTAPSPERALPATDLARIASEAGIKDIKVADNVEEAYKNALADVVDKSMELIFVGGSTFVVSDFLASLTSKR